MMSRVPMLETSLWVHDRYGDGERRTRDLGTANVTDRVRPPISEVQVRQRDGVTSDGSVGVSSPFERANRPVGVQEAWRRSSRSFARASQRLLARALRPSHRACALGQLAGVFSEPLDLEHHLAAHHKGDDLHRESPEDEAAPPIGRMVVAAPGQQSTAATGSGFDHELPG